MNTGAGQTQLFFSQKADADLGQVWTQLPTSESLPWKLVPPPNLRIGDQRREKQDGYVHINECCR